MVVRRVGPATLAGRGLRRRCPLCAGGDLFPRPIRMVDDCPTCGHHFERDAGYWIGAMIVATGLSLAAFLLVFTGWLLLTWPEVPWNLVLISTLVIAALMPVLVYPTSRTLWVALDLAVRPLDADEPS